MCIKQRHAVKSSLPTQITVRLKYILDLLKLLNRHIDGAPFAKFFTYQKVFLDYVDDKRLNKSQRLK